MTDPNQQAEQANALLELAENLSPLLDAVDGHREEMIRRGYSPTVAEAMALQFYGHMLAATFASIGSQPGGRR